MDDATFRGSSRSEYDNTPLNAKIETPPADKRHRVYEGGHFRPRTELVAESMKWLDKYLGPVQR